MIVLLKIITFQQIYFDSMKIVLKTYKLERKRKNTFSAEISLQFPHTAQPVERMKICLKGWRHQAEGLGNIEPLIEATRPAELTVHVGFDFPHDPREMNAMRNRPEFQRAQNLNILF